MKKNHIKKHNGFTVIELIIVLAIIGSLTAILITGLFNKMDETYYKNAEFFFAKTMPEALVTLLGRNGTVNGVDAARIQALNIKSNSEWGGNWTMAAPCANEQCVITYPVGGLTAASTDTNGTELAAKLTRTIGGQREYAHIVSAVYNAGADSLVVTLRAR